MLLNRTIEYIVYSYNIDYFAVNSLYDIRVLTQVIIRNDV